VNEGKAEGVSTDETEGDLVDRAIKLKLGK
jgi:hypothetical protein